MVSEGKNLSVCASHITTLYVDLLIFIIFYVEASKHCLL